MSCSGPEISIVKAISAGMESVLHEVAGPRTDGNHSKFGSYGHRLAAFAVVSMQRKRAEVHLFSFSRGSMGLLQR